MSMQDEDPTAPAPAQQQQAIPDGPDPAFAGAQGAPPPAQNTQALSQMVNAIPVQQNPGGAPPGEGDVNVQGSGAPPSQGIMDFLQGKGAAPQQEFDKRVEMAKQAGAANDSEAVTHAVASGGNPQEQGALLQRARIMADAGNAHAVAALQNGDAQKAAKFATAAQANIPDGNDTKFQAGKDSFTATVTGLGGGKPQQFKFAPTDFHQFLTGPDAKFDAMMDNPVQKALAQLGKGAPQASGGPGGDQPGGAAAPGAAESAGPPNPKGPYGEGGGPTPPATSTMSNLPPGFSNAGGVTKFTGPYDQELAAQTANARTRANVVQMTTQSHNLMQKGQMKGANNELDEQDLKNQGEATKAEGENARSDARNASNERAAQSRANNPRQLADGADTAADRNQRATNANNRIQQGEDAKTYASYVKLYSGAGETVDDARAHAQKSMAEDIKARSSGGTPTPQQAPQEDPNAQQAPAPAQHKQLPIGASSNINGVPYTKGQDGKWYPAAAQ